MIDMLAICGDTADNVPGVNGVGEVGAAKLIAKYGTLENIYEHLSELTSRQQAQFEEARPHMALSKALVTIKTDMDLPVTLEDMAYSGNFQGKLAQLFDFYEFSSLKRYLDGHIVSEGVASGEGLSSALLRNPVRANAPESPSPDASSSETICPCRKRFSELNS